MNKTLSSLFAVALLVITGIHQITAQTNITTQTNIPLQVLIADTLINGCTSVSNVTVNSNGAYGYFKKNNSQFPFASGIIIASGPISNAHGPNTSGSQGGTLGSGSDPDLVSLAGGGSIYDCTKIEFNFVPADDTVEFRYIFGSEEFPEYANSNFNDVFGFFLSGPGINGPYQNNAINIALLPNGQPVTINNVHNFSYYTAYPSSAGNSPGSYHGAVQYDGNTIVLTARAVVQPCQTYHIKLAVGDRGDSAFDSGVFFETNSFVSGAMIEGINHSQYGGEADLWEGCENYYVISRAPGAGSTEPVVVNLSVGGTATPNTDYTALPSQIVIPAGQTADTLFYSAFNDGIDEGTETIILNFYTTCPCGNMPSVISDTIFIFDAEAIKGGIQYAQTEYCGVSPPSQITLSANCNLDTVQYVNVYYQWSTGSTTNTTTITPQPGATTYYVTMADDCGNEVYDSITIRVSSMQFASQQPTPVSCNNACNGSYQVNVVNNFAPFTYSYVNANYVWWPDSIHHQYNGNFTNLCPGTYLVTVTDAIGCQLETEFTLYNPPPINHSVGITSGSQVFCANPGQISLSAEANQSNATFLWFNSTTQNNVTFTPSSGENQYWVRIYDACGNMFQDEVSITVSQIQAAASSTPDDGSCNGQAWVTVNGGISPYTYYWPLIGEFGSMQQELCYGTYTVNITDNVGCQATRQATVELNTSIEISEENKNLVYPNPAHNGFMVNLSCFDNTEHSIELIDLVGRTIYTEITSGNGLLYIGDLTPGTYIIRISDSQELKHTERIIVIE